MKGVIIQQTDLFQLEEAIRKIVREELASISLLSPPNNSPPVGNEPLLSRAEAARILKVSLPTFSSMVYHGLIKSYKVGKRKKYKESEILTAIATKQNSKH